MMAPRRRQSWKRSRECVCFFSRLKAVTKLSTRAKRLEPVPQKLRCTNSCWSVTALPEGDLLFNPHPSDQHRRHLATSPSKPSASRSRARKRSRGRLISKRRHQASAPGSWNTTRDGSLVVRARGRHSLGSSRRYLNRSPQMPTL